MKLIDVDHFIKSLSGFDLPTDTINACELRILLYTEPNVDAEPVKHGHWIERDGKHYCSLCSGHAPHDREFHERLTEWCCGCGAKIVSLHT